MQGLLASAFDIQQLQTLVSSLKQLSYRLSSRGTKFIGEAMIIICLPNAFEFSEESAALAWPPVSANTEYEIFPAEAGPFECINWNDICYPRLPRGRKFFIARRVLLVIKI